MIDFILVVLLRVAILAGLLFAVGLLMTKARPAMRAALALASLGACLVLPLATPVLRVSLPAPPQTYSEALQAEPSVSAPALLSVAPAPRAPSPQPGATVSIRPILAGLWAAGVLLLLARLMVGLVAARRLARLARTETVAGVDCRISAEATCPMCLAWPAGQIVLPESALALPKDQLEACLAHEAHHARRGDAVKLVFARLTRALFWPVPFVWLLERQLRAALEEAADDAAVTLRPDSASGYAQLLRDLAVRRTSAEAAALTMVTPLMLKTRIQRILSSSADRRPVRPASRLLLSTAVLGVGAVAAFGVFGHQEPEFKYDDRKIASSVKALTKSGKEIEIFEIQEDTYKSGTFKRIAWRPDGTPVNTEDMFPLSSGLKPMEDTVIVWARVRADGLHEPEGQVDRLLEGTSWMGYSGRSQVLDGWLYFNGIIRKPEGFLQSRVSGHLVASPWKSRTVLEVGGPPLADSGKMTGSWNELQEVSWTKGDVWWPDKEAMDKAYGHIRGQAQVMLITKVVTGTHVQIIMKESWQPSRMRIDIYDLQGNKMEMDYSPGLAGLKGRQRGYGLALNQTPDKIGKIVISERDGENFNAPRIHLAPVK